MPNIKTTRLPGGLRVITDRVDNVHSVALGVWIGVGTRHEDLLHNGVAHMVEHMLFKGTQNRSAREIVETIENVGGNFNAYTSREVTSYHIHLLKENVPLGLEVLADLIQNATLPEEELQKERHVVLQEIGMTEDTPDDLIFDHFYETAFPDQALGAPILGRADIVSNMDRETLLDYIRRFYTPSRIVISAAGNLEHDDFVARVQSLFIDLPPDVKQGRTAAMYEGGEYRTEKDLEQSHIIMGFRGLPRVDEDYYAAQALSTLLGGGMSSRLFQEVREKRGLVYSVFSFHSSYIDDGLFGIYAGTGPDDLKELVPVVCGEISKLLSGLSEEEVHRAKKQLRADLLMARESMMSRANQQAKYLLFFNEKLDISSLMDRIEAVDIASIRRAGERILSTRPTLAGLGPLENLEPFDRICTRLAA